jgi:hypothetical protein
MASTFAISPAFHTFRLQLSNMRILFLIVTPYSSVQRNCRFGRMSEHIGVTVQCHIPKFDSQHCHYFEDFRSRKDVEQYIPLNDLASLEIITNDFLRGQNPLLLLMASSRSTSADLFRLFELFPCFKVQKCNY